jgi:hypothetical protein
MGANLLPHLPITDFCDWLLAIDILAQQLFSITLWKLWQQRNACVFKG